MLQRNNFRLSSVVFSSLSLIQISKTAFINPQNSANNLHHTFLQIPHSVPLPLRTPPKFITAPLHSFVADGSDYSSSDADYEDDGEDWSASDGPGYRPLAVDAPTVEESPPPLSKNAANRFVAFVWDNKIDREGRDALDLHDNHVANTRDHVLYCRKANLFNETFNTNSMVDVVWSYPLLSADLQRYVGHALCLDSTSLSRAKEFLSNEPIIKSLTGGDISTIPLYRWRHIKDHSLRQDAGRFGFPTIIINLDHSDKEAPAVRAATNTSHLEYLIRSERVIQAGPLHICTEEKNDPASIAVGNIVIMNAMNRSHAIEFAENDPCAMAGLYETIRVHRFNTLDVTGKFVLDNIFDLEKNNPVDHMKDALEHWGYPVDNVQTPWLNY